MIGIAIKITGAVLILAGSMMAGRKMQKYYNKRRTDLKAMQDALKYADDAISIENALLDDVLATCGAKFFSESGGNDIFTMAAENLKSEFGSFERAWDKACAELSDKCVYLKKEDIECISGIGKALGLANTQRQSAHVASAVKRLASLEEDAALAQSREGRNAVKIALALSAAAIIILF